MGYLSSNASVSSAYSTGGQNNNNHNAASGLHCHFDDRQHLLDAVLDNKYLKRRSQIEQQRKQSQVIDLTRCCSSGLNLNKSKFRIHLGNISNNKFVMILVICFFLSSFWFLAGWISAYSYNKGRELGDDTKSLQDLADTIRRMRLRRHHALGRDNEKILYDSAMTKEEMKKASFRDDDDDSMLGNLDGKKHFKDEINIIEEGSPEDGVDPIQHLEAKIRQSQTINVKEEIKAKRLDDKMAESIEALKHSQPEVPDVEEESFA